MVQHKLVSSSAVVALWTPVRNFTNKANSHTPKVEPYKAKILPFWPLCCESEAKFRRSIAKTDISVTEPARLLLWTHRNFTKERVARRDLGNRASPVDRAHIKRPSFAFRHYHSVATQIESPPLVKSNSTEFECAPLQNRVADTTTVQKIT